MLYVLIPFGIFILARLIFLNISHRRQVKEDLLEFPLSYAEIKEYGHWCIEFGGPDQYQVIVFEKMDNSLVIASYVSNHMDNRDIFYNRKDISKDIASYKQDYSYSFDKDVRIEVLNGQIFDKLVAISSDGIAHELLILSRGATDHNNNVAVWVRNAIEKVWSYQPTDAPPMPAPPPPAGFDL
jgi:hypothetical protein